MNAQLRNSLVNPWLASLILFSLIVIFFLFAFAAMPKSLPTTSGITHMPWWAPFGGLAGAVAVYAGLTMVDKIGAGPFNGLIISKHNVRL